MIKSGDLADKAFLETALAGQEVLINVLGFMTPQPVQEAILDAAATAKVEWVIPTEFGSDTANPNLEEKLSALHTGKRLIREGIEARGLKWIGVVTNPWIDYVSSDSFFSSADSAIQLIYTQSKVVLSRPRNWVFCEQRR